MAKDPVLPLYYNDIDSATRDWTDEEFGAYLRLLIYQWDKGGLPKDYQRLTRIATSLSTTWEFLKKKFPEVDGFLRNPVMEEIRVRRLKHKAKQLENIQKRYQPSTKPPTKPPTETASKSLPLEIENEIENEMLIYNIEEFLLKNESQFEKVCMGVYKTREEVLPSLKMYHLWNVENGKYPKQVLQLIAGLQKWVLNQKNFSNGTHKHTTSGGSKSAGADEVAERLAAKLTARGKANT